jgi:hypothetical protein
MQGQIARLAAYGAYLVVVGLIGVLAFLWWLTRPVPTGGMNGGIAALTLIPAVVVVVALAAVHIVLARQLLAGAKR